MSHIPEKMDIEVRSFMTLADLMGKLPYGYVARFQWADLQVDLAKRDGQLEACGTLMSIDRKKIEKLEQDLADEKRARMEACEVLASNEALQKLLKDRGDQEFAEGQVVGEGRQQRRVWDLEKQLKQNREELGSWCLPADSSQSLSLGFSQEEIMRHMRENPEELAKAIQKVVVVPATPLSPKS